jgi:hypothetical protein
VPDVLPYAPHRVARRLAKEFCLLAPLNRRLGFGRDLVLDLGRGLAATGHGGLNRGGELIAMLVDKSFVAVLLSLLERSSILVRSALAVDRHFPRRVQVLKDGVPQVGVRLRQVLRCQPRCRRFARRRAGCCAPDGGLEHRILAFDHPLNGKRLGFQPPPGGLGRTGQGRTQLALLGDVSELVGYQAAGLR